MTESIAPGIAWWVCRCGRPLDRHSQRTRPNTGGRELVCSENDSGRFEPADRRYDYDENGLRFRDTSGDDRPPPPPRERPVVRPPLLRDLEIRDAEVSWGITGCKLFADEDGGRCQRPAELLWDVQGGKGIPACCHCADALLERQVALGDYPGIVLSPLRSW